MLDKLVAQDVLRMGVGDRQWIDTAKLPFTVRLISADNLQVSPMADDKEPLAFSSKVLVAYYYFVVARFKRIVTIMQEWEGSAFPRDINRPLLNLYHPKYCDVQHRQTFIRQLIAICISLYILP